MKVTDEMAEIAARILNTRLAEGNLYGVSLDMLQAVFDFAFGDEEAPRYTTRRMRQEIERAKVQVLAECKRGYDSERLPVGTKVIKASGYRFPGIVVSAFLNTDDQERFVVEAIGKDYKGMLHIFNGDQLRVVEAKT